MCRHVLRLEQVMGESSNIIIYSLQNYPSAYKKNPILHTLLIILFIKYCCFGVKRVLVSCIKSTKTKSVIHSCFHMYAAPSPHTPFNLSVLAGLVKVIRGYQIVCAKNGNIRHLKTKRTFPDLFEIRVHGLVSR